jgi:methionyl-tRNA formyltransferase
MVNRIVKDALAMGLKPILISTGNKRNRQFKVPTPPLISKFNVEVLRDIIAPHLKSKPLGQNSALTYQQLAKRHELDYIKVEDVNDPSFVQSIRDNEDIIGGVSVRFLQVFERDIIHALLERGFLWNLHSGLLPEYKGLLTPYRAIENGEKTYGLTLHETACGIDEGRIIALGQLPLDPSKSIMDLYLDSINKGCEILIYALNRVSQGRDVEAKRQEPSTSYYTNLTQDEFRQFTSQGIIYAHPIETTRRIVNAFTKAGTRSNSELFEKMIMELGLKSHGSRLVIQNVA